jgi:hypothetical protein
VSGSLRWLKLLVYRAIASQSLSLFFCFHRLAAARFLHCVLRLAPCVLDLSFDLLGCAFGLILGIAGPFSDLALHSACDVLHFSLNSILIHNDSSTMQD